MAAKTRLGKSENENVIERSSSVMVIENISENIEAAAKSARGVT